MRTIAIWTGNLFATLFLSGIFIVATNPVQAVGAVNLAAQRFTVSAIIFLALMCVGLIRPVKIQRDQIPLFALAAFLGVVLYNVLFFKGIALSGAVHGGVIIGFTPIITIVLQKIFDGETLAPMSVVGALVSVSGVLFFFYTQHGLQVSGFGADWMSLLGDLLFFAAAASWAGYTLTMRRLTGAISPLTVTAYSVMIGAVMLVTLQTIYSSEIPIDLEMINLPVLYLALFGTVGAFALWFNSVSQIGPAKTNIFLNFVPIFTAILAAFFLDASITDEMIYALGLVILGVVIVQASTFGTGPILLKAIAFKTFGKPER